MIQNKYINRDFLLASMFITYLQRQDEFNDFLDIYAEESTETLLDIAETWEKENEQGTFRQN